MAELITVEHLYYKSGHRELLTDINLTIQQHECWAVIGANGSGKTLLAELICGNFLPTSGSVGYSENLTGKQGEIAYISFEEQEMVMAAERKRDESWLMHGNQDPGTTAAAFLSGGRNGTAGIADGRLRDLVRLFRIEHILDRGLRWLSTGEFRKTVLCAALVKKPKLLLLEEPLDGLDRESRQHLIELLGELKSAGPEEGRPAIVLFVNRADEIPGFVSHCLWLDRGKIRYSGSAAGLIPVYTAAIGHRDTDLPIPGDLLPLPHRETGTFVEMHGVQVIYDGKKILNDITWRAALGEHWMISGPNGAGKSTILSLINGDNPKAYGQELYLFGKKRGSGESVWEIKSRIGFVSGDFQFSYHIRVGILDAVLSGFFDSIGLYQKPSGTQIETARRWLRLLGLADRETNRLHKLSFGEQRMVLIARAMVKKPAVLIADEPCQGLDDVNRAKVLSLLDRIGRSNRTQLLYVTHNPQERLPCIRRHIELVPAPEGGFTSKISSPA